MMVCLPSNFRYTSIFNNIFHGFRSHWRYTKNTKPESSIEYLLVLDFEATCEDNEKITQEIIEFPCLKLNATTFHVEATFHEYVRPVVLPNLSIFCIELTGILQEMVESADPFPAVFKRFEEWRNINNLSEKNSVFVTSGDWDLGRMFPSQCSLIGIDIPRHFHSWIDLKKLYGRETGELPKSLIEMIRNCGLHFQGRQHSGIDDCINIANVLRYLGKDRSIDLRPTSLIKRSPTGYRLITLS